ncbi:MAG: hypothetical protein R3212_09575, partial [Xanthomonadales bacterium]|nr:hypothetical protein [Xanthomonadales bacterium]
MTNVTRAARLLALLPAALLLACQPQSSTPPAEGPEAAPKPHYSLIIRIRNIAEHAVCPDDNDDFRNTRTTLANPLVRFLMAPLNVNYH